MIDQTEKIHEFIKQDKWLLIVLDACRYGFLDGFMDNVKAVRSPALNTPTWINKTWPDRYDAIYVSGTPWILKCYNGYEHFKGIENVWDYGWDSTLGTVPAENMVQAVKKTNDKKMVAHFMQPHMPYVKANFASRPLMHGPSVKNMVEKYGEGKVRKAYEDNVRYVVENVDKLMEWYDGPIAITADHGELLGDYVNDEKRYGHNEPDCETLRTVPWRVI